MMLKAAERRKRGVDMRKEIADKMLRGSERQKRQLTGENKQLTCPCRGGKREVERRIEQLT
jgi:hypothetical protein